MRSFTKFSVLSLVLLALLSLVSASVDAYCNYDEYCDYDETSYSCPSDCGSVTSYPTSYCGDGTCNSDEYGWCSDCGTYYYYLYHYCGDGYCNHDETSYSCSYDCGWPPSYYTYPSCQTVTTAYVSPGTIDAGQAITISGRVTTSYDNYVDPYVYIYLDGSLIATTYTSWNGYYSYTYSTSYYLSAGTHTIKTTSQYGSCTQGYAAYTFYVRQGYYPTYSPPYTPPCQTIVTTSVSPGTISTGQAITISGTVTSSYGTSVDPYVYIYLDESLIAATYTGSNGYYTYSYTTSNYISAGTHTIKTTSQYGSCTQGYSTAAFYVVGYTPSACTRQSPTVSITPYSQQGTAGSTLAYAVSVVNNDDLGCGSSVFSLAKNCPSGWSCSLDSNSLTISPGNTASTILRVTSPANTAVGTNLFSVTSTYPYSVNNILGTYVAGASSCTSSAWSCNAWSPAPCPVSGIQTRTCTLIDNTCLNPNAVKPSENQTCTYTPLACTSSAWSCTAWNPNICPASGTQTRNCTLIDTTCTDPNAVKPSETKSCGPACTINDWTCSMWMPSVCPRYGTQHNICTIKLGVNCDPDHPDTVKPSETRSCTQPEEPAKEPSSELIISSITLDSDCVAPGDEALLYVSVKNEGDKELKNVEIEAIIQELGIKETSQPSTIKKGSPTSKVFYFNIPDSTKPGVYYIKTSVTSRENNLVKYRDFEVDKNC